MNTIDFGIVRQQNVLSFDVTMDDLIGVQMSQSAQNLTADVSDPFFFEALSFSGWNDLNKKERKNKFLLDYVIPPLLSNSSKWLRHIVNPINVSSRSLSVTQLNETHTNPFLPLAVGYKSPEIGR